MSSTGLRDGGHVGLIGCGHMGRGLARNLVRHGHAVLAHDIDPGARASAVAVGARAAASIDELIGDAATVITCLPNLAAIEAVYGGATSRGLGLLGRCAAGMLLIDTSTNRPQLAERLGTAARAAGIGLVDAPLVGTAVEAWDGTLTVLAGGDDADVARALPFLQAVSSRVMRVGAAGQAHRLKALNNAVAMANHAVVCEVFAVAADLRLDAAQVFEVLRSGYGASRKLEDVAPKLIAGEHPRRAVLATPAKDLGIFDEMARASVVATPVLDRVGAVYRMLCELGCAGEPPSRLADLLTAHGPALSRAFGVASGDRAHAIEP